MRDDSNFESEATEFGNGEEAKVRDATRSAAPSESETEDLKIVPRISHEQQPAFDEIIAVTSPPLWGVEAEITDAHWKKEPCWIAVDNDDNPYLVVTSNLGGWNSLRVGSRACRKWLLERGVSHRDGMMNSIERSLKIQSSKCERAKYAFRKARQGNKVILDVCDSKNSEIHIEPGAWSVVLGGGFPFIRPPHQRALCEPKQSSDYFLLFQHLRIEQDSQKLLILAWMIASLYAGTPTPILIFVGQQGSAKTTATKRIKALIDPSSAPVLSAVVPSQLHHILSQHAVPALENVGLLTREIADLICAAVTGSTVQKRKLFTDFGQVFHHVLASIIINSTGLPSTRPDFLDRSIVIGLQRLTEFTALQDAEEKFEANKSLIFGAILECLAKVLEVLPSIPASSDFRMADFARIGRAVAVVLGKQPADFDAAYRENLDGTAGDQLNDAPFSKAVVSFAQGFCSEKPWVGTASELMDELAKIVRATKSALAKKDMPVTPHRLSIALNELAPALRTHGVVYQPLKRTNKSRPHTLFAFQVPDASEDQRVARLDALKTQNGENNNE